MLYYITIQKKKLTIQLTLKYNLFQNNRETLNYIIISKYIVLEVHPFIKLIQNSIKTSSIWNFHDSIIQYIDKGNRLDKV